VVHCAAKDKKAAEELIQFLITPAAKEQFKARGLL
jgi:ABC-type molybdate transport system substrate-binding protein